MSLDIMIRRLRVNSFVSDEDALVLKSLPFQIKEHPEETVFVREDTVPTHCCVVLSGFVFRSKTTTDGKRQILSFHPAGDMPDLHGLFLKKMDHDLTTLSRARLAFIEHRHVYKLIETRASLTKALWRETIVDASIFREWIVNLGTREAPARLAHLVAELRQRLSAVGLITDDEFDFPITQAELAEALGISSVHVNRVIQTLRNSRVLDITREKVTLKDFEQIIEIGGFDDLYLHQQERKGP
jgi:CRP-like cAMP-binding protein